MALQIKYYGVRGSLPVSGSGYDKFGGNTTCVYLESGDTHIIIDAGTGIRVLGNDMLAAGKNGIHMHLLFTHTHWDHIQGFPFFVPAYLPMNSIDVYGETKKIPTLNEQGQEILSEWSIERALHMQQHFMYFPVDTNVMSGRKTYHELKPGMRLQLGDIRVSMITLFHPNTTLGFRFDTGNSSFVYCTDVEHNDLMKQAVTDFASGADVLAYDCQYFPDEYLKGKVGWGHSTYEAGGDIARAAGVKELHMIHHDPLHDDATLERQHKEALAHFPGAIQIPEGYSFSLP